jgi:hypothetical protein
MSQRSKELAARAAEAGKGREGLPLSPSRRTVPHATHLPPSFAPRINRNSECLVAGTTFEERQEQAARGKRERLAAAAERSAAATLGTSGSSKAGGAGEGGRFFPAGAAAVLRRKRHGQIGAAVGEGAGGRGGAARGVESSSSSALLLRASDAAAKAAEAAAEAQAAARPFPLHSPALCPRSLWIAERRREEEEKRKANGGGGVRKARNVAPGAAGAEAAAAAEREEEWTPAAAAASGWERKAGTLPPRDPDAAVLLAARARRASRAAEAAARALAAAAALERECSFRPQRPQLAAVQGRRGPVPPPTSLVFHPPSAGKPLLASEVVPGCALHLRRTAAAREAAEQDRKRAEAVFCERPRARYVCTRTEPFSFSCEPRGDVEGRHAKAFEAEEAKCPFRPETRAAEDAMLLRELLA